MEKLLVLARDDDRQVQHGCYGKYNRISFPQ